jgi:hypothetical protein
MKPIHSADQKRRIAMWAALLLTLAATVWVAASEPAAEDAVATPSLPPPIVARQSPAPTESAYQARPAIEHEPQEVFIGDPPPAPERQAPPPKPTTPALPFRYAGKLIEDGKVMVFLSQDQRNLAVHAGDVIDDTWRVESIRPPTMTLVYLPLKTEVPLAIGEMN